MVRHVVCDHLGVDDIALALMAGLVQGLRGERQQEGRSVGGETIEEQEGNEEALPGIDYGGLLWCLCLIPRDHSMLTVNANRVPYVMLCICTIMLSDTT